jgi:hypothetical protein
MDGYLFARIDAHGLGILEMPRKVIRVGRVQERTSEPSLSCLAKLVSLSRGRIDTERRIKGSNGNSSVIYIVIIYRNHERDSATISNNISKRSRICRIAIEYFSIFSIPLNIRFEASSEHQMRSSEIRAHAHDSFGKGRLSTQRFNATQCREYRQTSNVK